MSEKILRLKNSTELPAAIKRSLGVGKTRIKVFQRPEGELIAKAIQDIGEVAIRLIYISKGDKAKSIDLTDREIHLIMLMARDLSKGEGQPKSCLNI